MEAVESAIPLYESISEAISFGLAGPLRRRAIEWLARFKEGWTLDLGSGPGVSTRFLVSQGFQKVVGLDPSQRLLKFAKGSVGSSFHPVVGIAERLPFRTKVFESVLTCFALRDVRNLVQSLREVSRVSKPGGRFAIVDVGKPDGIFRKNFVWLYVRFGMPLLARLLTQRRLRGNPFRMIIPTFQWLVTNDSLRVLIEHEFGPSHIRELMFGGLVVYEARKAGSTNEGVVFLNAESLDGRSTGEVIHMKAAEISDQTRSDFQESLSHFCPRLRMVELRRLGSVSNEAKE